MKKFMRWLLNVPDGNLVNVLRMNDMNNGKNDFKRLFEKIKYIFDVDIEKLVGDSIYKTHGSKDPKEYSLTDYFRTLVREFDDIMGPPTDPLKRNAAGIEKMLEYKYTNEASVDGRVSCMRQECIIRFSHWRQLNAFADLP